MRWTGHVACIVEDAYGVLAGRPERKRPLEGSRRRCNGNIKWYVQDTGWSGMGYMKGDLNRDMWRAVVVAVMNLRVS